MEMRPIDVIYVLYLHEMAWLSDFAFLTSFLYLLTYLLTYFLLYFCVIMSLSEGFKVSSLSTTRLKSCKAAKHYLATSKVGSGKREYFYDKRGETQSNEVICFGIML